MSTDCSTSILVGYCIAETESGATSQVLLGGHTIPAKYIKVTNITDRSAETKYSFKGKDNHDIDSFLDAVAKEVGGRVYSTSNDEDGFYTYWIGPSCKKLPYKDGGFDYAKLVNAFAAVTAIGRDLLALGFKVGKPRIEAGLDIG